jgi:hypothetical protein
MNDVVESQANVIRTLLADLRTRPHDDKLLSVLADWCEDKGLPVATDLREGRTFYAVNALRMLFGEAPMFGVKAGGGFGENRGRYSEILSFRPIEMKVEEGMEGAIRVRQELTLRAQPRVLLKLKKLVVSENLFGHLNVMEVVVNGRTLLDGPAPLELFSVLGPELFDETLQIASEVRVTLGRIRLEASELRGTICGLGIGAGQGMAYQVPQVPSGPGATGLTGSGPFSFDRVFETNPFDNRPIPYIPPAVERRKTPRNQ